MQKPPTTQLNAAYEMMMVLGTVAALTAGGQGVSAKREVANCVPTTITGNKAMKAEVENPEDGSKEDNAKRTRSPQGLLNQNHRKK